MWVVATNILDYAVADDGQRVVLQLGCWAMG